MQWQDIIGYVAGVLTTTAVVPQIVKAWRTRQVDDISIYMVITLISGVGMWTAYGFIVGAWPIIVTNGTSVLLNSFLLGLVLQERGKKRSNRL